MTYGRIDTHQHALPPALKRWLVDHGHLPPKGGPPWANWDRSRTLEFMDSNDIVAAVLSAPAPSSRFGDMKTAQQGVRVFNEGLASVVAENPARFGFFAYLPIAYPALAVSEAAYAFDQLGADGVLTMTNAAGCYLGDVMFDQIFSELNDRHAVVFTHPNALPGTQVETPAVPIWIADFMLDTTRAALNLIASGSLDRAPNVSVILPHGGGFLPYIAGRLLVAAEIGAAPDADAICRHLPRFYYDTAGPMSPYSTPSLLQATAVSQILFGSDWHQLPAESISNAIRNLDKDPLLDASSRTEIYRDNALRLLPRLAQRIDDARQLR
ncbi:MAG: amidohydrolase family protein [Egibacteraceae bacterium]